MLGENNQNEVERPWAESQGGGRIGTPFSEEILGVPYGLPSRLVRLADLPWYHCYEMQLSSEKKSEHTLRAYRTGLKQFVTTVLPGELPASYDALQNMSVKEISRWIDPNNGRLDLLVQSISNISPATINAR